MSEYNNQPAPNPYGGPDYSGQSFAQPQQAPQPPKKNNLGLKIGGGVLALAIVAGGGIAVANTLNAFGDKDIAKAFPATTVMYSEVDLDPANDQKAAALSLVNKVKEISDDKDAETKDIGETITDPFFKKLDYDKEVKPWLGGKAALGVWTDGEKANEKNAKTAVIYEVKDKAKAQEALDKVQGDKVKGEIVDGYLIVAEKDDSLSSYKDQLKAGSLDKDEEFKNDRKLLTNNTVALGWVDLGGVDTSQAGKEYASMAGFGDVAGTKDPVTGRVVAGLSLDMNGATLSAKAVSVKGAGSEDAVKNTGTGAEEIKTLPDSSMAAISINGLDEGMKKIWEKNQDSIRDNSSVASTVDQLETYGIFLPEDFTKIFGKETALGVGFAADKKNPAIQYRAVGGDIESLRSLTDGAGGSDVGFELKDNDGTAALNFGEAESTTPLGESKEFNEILPDLDKAQVAGYVNFDKIKEVQKLSETDSGDSKNSDAELGKLGFTASHDNDKDITDLTVRWRY